MAKHISGWCSKISWLVPSGFFFHLKVQNTLHKFFPVGRGGRGGGGRGAVEFNITIYLCDAVKEEVITANSMLKRTPKSQ